MTSPARVLNREATPRYAAAPVVGGCRENTGLGNARQPLKQRTKLIGSIIVVLGISAISAIFLWKTGQPEQKAGPATARVVRRDFATVVQATGAIKPQVGAEVKVGPRISGRLQHLAANIGDAVTQGQVIAELEKLDLEAALAQRRAEVAAGEARVAEAAARLKLAELELERAQSLRAKEITSQHDLDAATMASAVAQAALRLAMRQVEASVAARQEAEARLSFATITAPITGVVSSVSTQEGETVSAGLSSPTFVTLINLNRLQVDAFVDEVDIGKVRAGQRAVFTVDAFPGLDFEGRVATIYPKAVIHENVVNYDVVVHIETPYSGQLRPDMTANVTIFLEARPGVLALPTQAVKRERGKNVAYVSNGGRIESREIKVGWKEGSWIEIVSGLQEGDLVLLEAPANHF
jgi:HlyD family secretion protein